MYRKIRSIRLPTPLCSTFVLNRGWRGGGGGCLLQIRTKYSEHTPMYHFCVQKVCIFSLVYSARVGTDSMLAYTYPYVENFYMYKATPFFFSMFRVGRARDSGAGFRKKIRHTYMYMCAVTFYGSKCLGAQQQHASSSHTTLSTLCVATCIAHVTAHRPAFSLQISSGHETGLQVQSAASFHRFSFFFFLLLFSALPDFGRLTRRET